MIHIYAYGPDLEKKLTRVLSMMSDGDMLLLVGDGVLNAESPLLEGRCVFALDADLAARGLGDRILGLEVIGMARMVDLIASDASDPITW